MKVVYIGAQGKVSRGKFFNYLYPYGHLEIGAVYTVLASERFPFSDGLQLAYFLAEKCRIRMDPGCRQEFGQSIPYGAKDFVPLEYYRSEFECTEDKEKEEIQR